MRALMTDGHPVVAMVRARSRRPVRRNRNAGPSRTRKVPAPLPDAAEPLDERKSPNLAALRAGDRQQHLRQARRAGLSRKQASRHADEHLREA